jgi:hypothetical protein
MAVTRLSNISASSIGLRVGCPIGSAGVPENAVIKVFHLGMLLALLRVTPDDVLGQC